MVEGGLLGFPKKKNINLWIKNEIKIKPRMPNLYVKKLMNIKQDKQQNIIWSLIKPQ